jgi:hypothetical protein
MLTTLVIMSPHQCHARIAPHKEQLQHWGNKGRNPSIVHNDITSNTNTHNKVPINNSALTQIHKRHTKRKERPTKQQTKQKKLY